MMKLIYLFLSLFFFFIGMIGHEYIHVYQLKKLGIKKYKVCWFPPHVECWHKKDQIIPNLEMIPSFFSIICSMIAGYLLWKFLEII